MYKINIRKYYLLFFILIPILLTSNTGCRRNNDAEIIENNITATATPAPTIQPSTPTPMPVLNDVILRVMLCGPGGDMPDTESVINYFNNILSLHLPNTTADINFIQADEYEERLKLMLASDDPVDLANLNNGYGGGRNVLFEEANNGSLLALDGMLAGVPELFEVISDAAWARARVNNQIFMVPVNKDMTDMFFGIKTQRELADAYLEINALKNTLERDNGIVREETYEILTEYLSTLLQNNEIRG